jgi:predicted phage-related endonuclease
VNAPEKVVDRQFFIGGSDAAGILKVSPWDTPLDIYLKKTGQIEHVEDPAKERLFRRGKLLEPIVVKMLRDDYGITITKRSTHRKPNRYRDHEHGFMAAEIDFEWRVTKKAAEDFGLERGLVGSIQNGEVKTVHVFASAKFGEAETEDVPVEYAAQAMHGLMVTGRKLCMFGVLVGADNLSVYWIKRDDAVIAEMRKREVAFWNEHVLPRVPPAPENLPDVLSLFRRAPASEVQASGEVLQLCEELERAKQAAEAAEDWQVDCKYQIGRFMLGEAGMFLTNKGKIEPGPTLTPGVHLLKAGGATLLKVSLQSQSRIDTALLREHHPEIAAECTKSNAFVKFERPRGKRA